MPTKRMFDLGVIIAIGVHLGFGVVRLAGRRWHAEGSGTQSWLGATVRASIGG